MLLYHSDAGSGTGQKSEASRGEEQLIVETSTWVTW